MRALIATGRPIQPHDALPLDYAMPQGHTPWRWVPLLPDVAQVLQLGEGASHPDAADRAWVRVNPPAEGVVPTPLPGALPVAEEAEPGDSICR